AKAVAETKKNLNGMGDELANVTSLFQGFNHVAWDSAEAMNRIEAQRLAFQLGDGRTQGVQVSVKESPIHRHNNKKLSDIEKVLLSIRGALTGGLNAGELLRSAGFN